MCSAAAAVRGVSELGVEPDEVAYAIVLSALGPRL